jgi:hypothetical protein
MVMLQLGKICTWYVSLELFKKMQLAEDACATPVN